MALLFPAHKNESFLVLALETHFTCVSGTQKSQYGMLPSLEIDHISLLELGKDLWVTLSICHLSSWGVTPQHRCQARPKMEQSSLEAELSMWCTSSFFCLRGQEESWWPNFVSYPSKIPRAALKNSNFYSPWQTGTLEAQMGMKQVAKICNFWT